MVMVVELGGIVMQVSLGGPYVLAGLRPETPASLDSLALREGLEGKAGQTTDAHDDKGNGYDLEKHWKPPCVHESRL